VRPLVDNGAHAVRLILVCAGGVVLVERVVLKMHRGLASWGRHQFGAW